MKYTIEGIQQQVLIGRGYAVIDAVILSYLRNIFTSKSKKIKTVVNKQGTVFYYVNIDKMVENLPIINIAPHTLQTNYIKKYVDADILLREPRRFYYRENGKLFYHPIFYYRFSKDAYKQLFTKVASTQNDTYY